MIGIGDTDVDRTTLCEVITQIRIITDFGITRCDPRRATSDFLSVGGTVIDSTLSNLDAIRTIWKGSGTYASRVSQLSGALLSASKVAGNGKQDTLTGATDALDLFFGELGDVLTDRSASETLQQLT